MISDINLNYLFIAVNACDSLIKSLQMCERIPPLYLISYAQHKLQYNISVLLQLFKSQTRSNMQISKLTKQSQNKISLNKKTLGVQSSADLASTKGNKKKSKNTIIIPKSSTIQMNTIKPKSREKQKNVQTSFNEVVNKFKKLFDEKIKFVKEQTVPTTERINIKANKSNTQTASDNKVKKIFSTVNLDRKNANKHGISELMSNIQAKLNMHRKIKQEEYESVEMSESPSAVLLDYMYKNKKKSLKSKQKIGNKSKQKFRNISGNSGNLSTTKKTEKPVTFQSIQQANIELRQKRIKSKSKSKTKINASKSKKVNQFLINDKSKGQMTIRQNYRSGNLSQGKYKSRLKTFESENAEVVKGEKDVKNGKKSKKQKKKQQGKLKLNMQKINQKQLKPKSRLSMKQKHSRSKSPISARFQQQNREKKLKVQKYKLTDKVIKAKKQIPFNNQRYIVSSSSDVGANSDEQSDILYENIEKLKQSDNKIESEEQQVTKRRRIDRVQGSIITYDVGNEGQLKFSNQIIDTDSQQEDSIISKDKTERQQQIISQAEKLSVCNIQCLVDYLVGFKDYVYYINRKRLIQQFQDNKSVHTNNIDSKQNSYKTPSTFGRLKSSEDKKQPRLVKEQHEQRAQKQEQIKQKESMKLQHVLRQQEIKWLDLKANLQRIKNIIINKKQDQCGQQLDKIIRQAECNHLLLKSMEIKDITQASANDRVLLKQKNKQISEEHKGTANGREQQIKQSAHEQSSISCIKQYMHVEQLQSRSSDCVQHKQQGSSSLLEYIPELQTTVKAPIRTSPNQININININDNQIKIESPNTNTKIVTNKKQMQHKNSGTNKLDIIRNSPPKKNSIVKIIKQVNMTDTIANKLQAKQDKGNAKQLSQSQLQLKILINQCKQEQNNKNSQKQSPINQVLQHIFQTNSNQHNFKSINYVQPQPQPSPNNAEHAPNNSSSSINSGYKKTKLSYDEAPLQIKKIFKKQNDLIKEVEHKSKEMSKKLLKADLDLSDFMSNQAHNSENNSLEGEVLNGQAERGRKTKILTQLKSPKNYKVNANGIVSSHSSTGNMRGDKVNKNIKISLFSKQKDKQKSALLNRLCNSEGQLVNDMNGNDQINELNSSVESKNSGSKNNITIERIKNKNNNNFIIFKQKNKNKSDKSIEISNGYVSPPKSNQNIQTIVQLAKQITQHEQFVINTPQPTYPNPNPNPQPQNSSMLNSNAQSLKSSGSSKYRRRRIFQPQPQLQIQVEPKSTQKKFEVYKQLFPWLKPNPSQNIVPSQQARTVELKKMRTEQDKLLLQELSYKDKDEPPFPSPVGRQIQASSFLTAELARRFNISEQQKQKELVEQNKKINKFVLKKPKYIFSQIQECNQNVFEQIINQFIQQLFKQNGYFRIGNHLVEHYNMNSIEINQNEEQQKQKQKQKQKEQNKAQQVRRQTRRINIQRAIQQNKHIFQANTMTNRQIDQFDEEEIEKQFQRCFEDENTNENNNGSENESNQRVDMSKYNIGVPEQKISKDCEYILSLALKLLNYIHDDEQKYQQFIKRLKKPLGVDSLTLLKLLRENDEVDEQQQYADAQNDNDHEMNIPEAEDVVDAYYVISLETLVQFQVQSSSSNATSNQQFLNQALYDKINMILDTIRPFGTKGLPSINFIHRYKQFDHSTRKTKISQKFEEDYKQKFIKIGSFEQIKNFVIKQLCESLKIRLGLFNYDIESDRIIQFSFNKMINQYIYQLEQQWRSFNEGQFEVKHTILLALQDMILDEEVRCLGQLLNKSNKLINY